MYLEYCRLAYRFFVPRKERSVAGEITAITGAGSGKFTLRAQLNGPWEYMALPAMKLS